MPRLRAISLRQTRRILALLDAHGRAADVVSSRDDDRRGGFVAVRHPDAGAVVQRLRARRVFTDSRRDLLRLGPAPYLTDAEIDRGTLAVIEELFLMTTPRYVPQLDRSDVDEAARLNRTLWGSGRTEAEHLAYTAAQLAHAGPELLRYVGLVSAQGLVAASKRYSLLFRAGGREARVLGIGAVFTRESERGKGTRPR